MYDTIQFLEKLRSEGLSMSGEGETIQQTVKVRRGEGKEITNQKKTAANRYTSGRKGKSWVKGGQKSVD